MNCRVIVMPVKKAAARNNSRGSTKNKGRPKQTTTEQKAKAKQKAKQKGVAEYAQEQAARDRTDLDNLDNDPAQADPAEPAGPSRLKILPQHPCPRLHQHSEKRSY